MKRDYETISPETMSALCEYDWPGNIRELQNLIERAVTLCTGPVLRVPVRDLHHRTITMPSNGHTGQHQTLEEAERAHILQTLKNTKWVVGGPKGAASRLGMNRSTLQFRMKKLGIVRPGLKTMPVLRPRPGRELGAILGQLIPEQGITTCKEFRGFLPDIIAFDKELGGDCRLTRQGLPQTCRRIVMAGWLATF
jgi:hypothetical protein